MLWWLTWMLPIKWAELPARVTMIVFIPSTSPSVKVMSTLASWFSVRGLPSALVANSQQQILLRSVGELNHEILDFKTLQPVELDQQDKVSAPPNSVTSFATYTKAKHSYSLKALHQKNNSFAISVLAIYWALQILRFRLLWSRPVRALKCQVVFIWGDNAGTTNGELLRLLKRSGATLIHLPVSLSDQNIIARLRLNSDVYKVTSRKPIMTALLIRCFPEQAFNFDGGRILYYHPGEAWAMALLGALPSRPWILGESRADFVCLADTVQSDYWRNRGTRGEKIRVIGNLDMHDLGRDIGYLRDTYFSLFTHRKRLVLVNMPNLVEHSVMSDWPQFWADVSKIMAPFAGEDLQVVINLHPKSEPKRYAWLEQSFGCLVTQGNIGAWIGFADLFISCCSTTELIAGELGVPVVDIGAIYFF